MGREGVAYTFVTPEEGNELTRIEMRINKLLKRDEVPGFEAVRVAASAGRPAPTEPITDGSAAEVAAPTPPKPAPPQLGRGGRPPKRFRRAL
jgi:ATP-dependent RNA helicase DeaD